MSRGWPDLFVYDPEKKVDWFFVETKGPREGFTPGQTKTFASTEARVA
jgi:hypothetical protein